MANFVTENLSHALTGPANLSLTERGISVALGLGLAATAARPRPNLFLSATALAAGSYLAYRGATGRCPVKAMLSEG